MQKHIFPTDFLDPPRPYPEMAGDACHRPFYYGRYIVSWNRTVKKSCQLHKALKVLGLKTARIVRAAETELPVLEAKGSRKDFVFLLEDDTYLHLEFQTTTKKKDIKDFLLYDARLVHRDGRDVQTAVVYSGQIKNAPDILKKGSITYQVTNIFLTDRDGDEEYVRLRDKIEKGQNLNDEDVVKLIFLPLMESKLSKGEMTIQAAQLAKKLPEDVRPFVLGSVVALSDRYLPVEYKKRLLEVLSMTDIEQWIREKANTDTAKAALREGSDVEFVVKITRLSRETVLRLKDEVEQERLQAVSS